MDALLTNLGYQTVNFAIKSGIALTSKYAVQQCARLLKTVDDKSVYAELKSLQKLLNTKIKVWPSTLTLSVTQGWLTFDSQIVSPAIDLILLKSGRGNSFLDAAQPLASSLHREIVRLGKRLQDAAATEEEADRERRRPRVSEAHHAELAMILGDIKRLLDRIDRDIPFIQLAITASGENMSTPMNPREATFSPSRLMQASTLVSFGDLHFNGTQPIQVGPSFTLTLYMLFVGHSRAKTQNDERQEQNGEVDKNGSPTALQLVETPEKRSNHGTNGTEISKEIPYGIGETDRKPIWQEVMHKARVRLLRTPMGCTFDPLRGYCTRNGHNHEAGFYVSANGYSYHLEIIEDLDDGRMHEDRERGFKSKDFEGVRMAGIREAIPIHQFSKIFYTDTGVILNIGDAENGYNNPVLLLKRDLSMVSPHEMPREPSAPSGIVNHGYSDDESDDQDEIDRQLWEESHLSPGRSGDQNHSGPTNLPPHLDPEWLALEVHMDDDGDDSGSETADEDDSVVGTPQRRFSTDDHHLPHNSLSADSNLIQQFRQISLHSDSPAGSPIRQTTRDIERRNPAQQDMPRSPFDAVTSSLSLLEMLIRLTSLQESQQVSHLAIPDDFTMHFLQNTTTTGYAGEMAQRIKDQAKRRMGFDPYDDGDVESEHGKESGSRRTGR
ncbi:putative Ran-specific GTPase-activating protein [Triangularia setosa]|uniref:Ran-specific GTPase-activating protein n=1 Tax=Triangularia setosa TaxID=2587417 RepID=A0AAN6VZA2_9PEZI|nr:putative Ran-specific GTPase-activating protein [Podospora setosa]